MKVFYFCHCCCKQLVKFNNFECSDNLNEINPSNDKLTFKDVSNIGWINFIKTFFYRSDIKMHLHFNSFSVEFQPSSN